MKPPGSFYDYALAEDPTNPSYIAKRRLIEAKIPKVEKHALATPIMLLPVNQFVPSLELNHRSARELYEQVGQSAGIHVKFDPTGVDSPSSVCPDCI